MSSLLAQLIAPESPEVFFEKFWRKQSTTFPGSSKLSLPFGTDNVVQELCDLLRHAGPITRAQDMQQVHPKQPPHASLCIRTGHDVIGHYGSKKERIEEVVTSQIKMEEAADLLENDFRGVLLGIAAPHVFHAGLMEFCTQLRSDLGYPGFLTSYLFAHAAEGKGRGLHYGVDETFFIQLKGERLFRCSREPVVIEPSFSATLKIDGSFSAISDAMLGEAAPYELKPADEVEVVEHHLRPGDVLYFPPGCVHATSTVGEGSIGLAVAVVGTKVIDLVSDFMLDQVDAEDLAWRSRLPRPSDDFTEVVSTIEGLIASRLAQADTFSSTLRRTVLQQLSQVTAPLLAHLPSSELSKSSRLRVHPAITFVRNTESDEGVISFFADEQEVVLDDPRMKPFALGLLRNRNFSVQEMLDWGEPPYQYDELADKITSLVDAGFMVVEE